MVPLIFIFTVFRELANYTSMSYETKETSGTACPAANSHQPGNASCGLMLDCCKVQVLGPQSARLWATSQLHMGQLTFKTELSNLAEKHQ